MDRARQARLRDYLNNQQLTGWWPLSEWPSWAVPIALKEHKTGEDRYDLFFFLGVNGMDPEQVVAIVTAADVDQGYRLVPGVYDRNAWRHIDQLLFKHQNGTLYEIGKTFKDMKGRRLVKRNASGREIVVKDLNPEESAAEQLVRLGREAAEFKEEGNTARGRAKRRRFLEDAERAYLVMNEETLRLMDELGEPQ